MMAHVARQDYRAGTIQLMAFLGRYGHQSLDTMLHTPLPLLQDLGNAVAELLEAEKDQLQNTVATGGGG